MDSGWVAARFDQRASTYDRSASHRCQARRAVELLAPTAGERVLDVATGTGLAAREVLSRLERTGSVVGTDVAAGMLRAARLAAETVEQQRVLLIRLVPTSS